MHIAINTAVFLLTLAGMEVFAWFAHKYVMHGWGWGWHKSHHEPRAGWFEKNDLYAVVFAGIAADLPALVPAHPVRYGDQVCVVSQAHVQHRVLVARPSPCNRDLGARLLQRDHARVSR